VSATAVTRQPIHGHEPPAAVRVDPGPLLLADLSDTPSLAAHRAGRGTLPETDVARLAEAAERVNIEGRGGAGFPFATKLRLVARGRRPIVVVNAAEGEPLSAKDTGLLLVVPHRVLDGAAVTARALGAREVSIVVPSERPAVGRAVATAIDERRAAGERLRWRVAETAGGFVSGQARAVVELLSGRPNLPVTAWQPEGASGVRGRPTLLANAETWAHVGDVVRLGPTRYAARGTAAEPGTTLLTLPDPDRADGRVVVEVDYGTPWAEVLGRAGLQGRPLLLGGYHGTWVAAGGLAGLTVSRSAMRAAGLALGAGIVAALPGCPVVRTADIAAYLAGESAGRCGPCVNGLPALAEQLGLLARGDASGAYSRMLRLTQLVERRGACAHPDGTVRLVRSMLTAFDAEVGAHLAGRCQWPT